MSSETYILHTVGDLRRAIRRALAVYMGSAYFMDGKPVRVIKVDVLDMLKDADSATPLSDVMSTYHGGPITWDGDVLYLS